jgi:hypothetical protein
MMRFPFLVLALALIAGNASCFLHAQDKNLPELNRKVLEFAKENNGKKVGDGECWTLAAEALKAAGAREPMKTSKPAVDGEYHITDFGRKLEGQEKIVPGDIVQFEKAKVVNGKTTWFLPHHTAIVYSTQGRKLTLIHQNYNEKRFVFVFPLDLAGLREGTMEVYRPVGEKDE